MANTTVTGALAIHGQNPQVSSPFISFFLTWKNSLLVSYRNRNKKPHLWVWLLEGTLFCSDRSATLYFVHPLVFRSVSQRKALSTKPLSLNSSVVYMAIKGLLSSYVYCLNYSKFNPRRKFSSSTYVQMNSSEHTIYGSWSIYISYSTIRYLRALAVFYVRMTFQPAEVYEILEPLLKDYRKLRQRSMSKPTK